MEIRLKGPYDLMNMMPVHDGCFNIPRQRIDIVAVYMSPVNRASTGHEIVSSAAKDDLNLR